MALDAGVMTMTVEFAQGLKDKDFFGRMDPYAVITVGSQTFRTKTVQSGGVNPVFNETFKFNIINENDFHIILKDEDVTSDERIGQGRGDMAKARANKTDRIQVPMMSKSGKQHGFVSISLSFAPNNAGHAPAAGGHPPPQQYAAPYGAPPPQQYAYPPPQYGAPPPHYGAPPPQYAPQPYAAPPPGHYPPQPYGAPPQYPPQPYGAPPYGAPQYPPRPY